MYSKYTCKMSMFRKIFKPGDEKSPDDSNDDIRNLEYKRKVDPSFRDPCGKSHVHILLEHGYDNPEDLDYVLACGCSIDIKDNDGNYPIHIAVRRGLNKCVRKLIQRNSLLDVFNKEDVTPLMAAAQTGNADSMFIMLQNGANPNLTNQAKRTAMHYVCVGGSLRCLKLLLEAKGKVNYQDTEGFSPIIYAARHGHVEQVQCLVEYDCFPKTNPNKQDSGKRTALHWAVDSGHEKVVKLLLSKPEVDTDISDAANDTPFSIALKCNQPAILKMLVDAGCYRGVYDGLNGTCLGLAALFGMNECLQILLDSDKATNDLTYFGITPLMAAVFESHVGAAKILLEAGANVNTKGRNGTHAFPMALMKLTRRNEEPRHELVRLLLRYGTDPFATITPDATFSLYLAGLMRHNCDMISLAIQTGYISIVRMLLLVGARIKMEYLDALSQYAYMSHGSCVTPGIIDLLGKYHHQPVSLRHATRACIRKSIGSDVVNAINSLPIAKPLQRYLHFEELDHVKIERSHNGQILFCSSSFSSFTPCGAKALTGSLLHEYVTPTIFGQCPCSVCVSYSH